MALWREGLLARAALRRETRGYRHHPQLRRFRAHRSPLAAINNYLKLVLLEADARGYSFDGRKVGPSRPGIRLTATQGQLEFERRHLLRKLRRRNPRLYRLRRRDLAWEPHPLFRIVTGGVEAWERQARRSSLSAPRRSAVRGR